MTRFRPCIDLHDGQVKQIVGGTLGDNPDDLVENHVSEQSPAWFASKYRDDALTGGHVIKLGQGNDQAARLAMEAYPGGLQIGGGINASNAANWIEAGASHVIVTSWLFSADGQIDPARLDQLKATVGRQRIVIDLSCRRTNQDDQNPTWSVAMNRWQTITSLDITPKNLSWLAGYADEFLIHAADVEGLCGGVDQLLIEKLASWTELPTTYAGGVATLADAQWVRDASCGALDLTVGSALDIFGGSGVRYRELVQWNQADQPGG